MSPLVACLAAFDDEAIAKQVVEIVVEMCRVGDESVYGEFVARVSDRVSSGALAWSRRQVFMVMFSDQLRNLENLIYVFK